MPRVTRTIIPRIKKSLRERGFTTTLRRSFLLPLHLLREYRVAKSLRPDLRVSEFDRAYGVDTDGRFGGWTYLSDLDINSANWIDGHDYLPIEPDRFKRVLESFDIAFEGLTFIDFGSGKGRALLMASEYPFRQIIGLEFSPELHRIAEGNITRYFSPTQKCRKIRSQNVDFTNFTLPPEASVLFFFDPCRGRVLADVTAGIARSLLACPRPLYVAYVAPRPELEQLFASAGFLKEIYRSDEMNFRIYQGGSGQD
ncbi:MAG: class I SAM-dependent methyltransferase [Candidatus Sulfotelmatobacter sp.]